MINYIDFQVKILFVDDSQPFLDSVNMVMDDHVLADFVDNSQSFLNMVKKQNFSDEIKHIFCEEENDTDSQSVVSIDLKQLSQLIKNLYQQKNWPIAVLFMDYNLPDTTGLELIKHIENEHIRKILLTGEFDNQESIINAFNHGKINGYISKRTTDLKKEIDKIIDVNKKAYLLSINQILDGFFVGKGLFLDLYKDEAFEDFYQKICKDLNIIASSVYELYGSRILFSADKAYSLNIYHEDELEDLKSQFPDILKNISDQQVLDFKSYPHTCVPDLNENYMKGALTNALQTFLVNGKMHFITIKEIKNV